MILLGFRKNVLGVEKVLMALFGLHFANNGLMDDEKSEATVLGRKPADFLR